MPMKFLTTLILLLGLASVQAQPTQQYSHGDPSDAEQLMLEYINRARANPSAEVQLLFNSSDPNVNSAISQFSVNQSLVVSDFNAISAKPPIAFQAQLSEAARKHSELMIDQDQQSHQLPGELDLSDRILAEGYTFSSSISFGENVYAYMTNPFMGHAAFEIDWGNGPDGVQVPPGHRNNIHDVGYSNDATEIGISILADNNSTGTTVTGPFVVTQDFARPSQPTHYVLGVVYEDKDGDSFYSEGEGLGGVTITPDQGDWFAMSSSSGGYAIPLENVSGTITLTASGGQLSADESATFQYSGENVKVDFVVSTTNSGGSGNGSGSGNGGGTPVIQDPAVDFGNDATVISNYVLTTWFAGFFDLSQSGAPDGWLYHDEHAAIYYTGDENGMWFYSSSLGWTYTDRTLYPNLYVNAIGWVFYYEQGSTQRIFFDFAQGRNFFNDPTVDDQLTYF